MSPYNVLGEWEPERPRGRRPVYIGVGAIVLILIIVVIVLLIR